MSSISTSAGIAVVVTRSCIGVWDFMTGQVCKLTTPKSRTPRVQMKYTLANSALGAIITHALVTEDGGITVAAESGDVLYWNMEERTVIFQVRCFRILRIQKTVATFKEKQPDVLQIFFYKNQTRCIAASRL